MTLERIDGGPGVLDVLPGGQLARCILASRMHLVSFSALIRISLMAKSPMMMAHEIDAGHELHGAEGQPRDTGEGVHGRSRRSAAPPGRQSSPLRSVAAGKADDQAQRPGRSGRSTRAARTPGRRSASTGAKKVTADHADGAGRQRRRWRKSPGPGPPRPWVGQLVAFHGRGHRGGLARDVDQDGGGRAAVHGPVVDGGHHDDGRRRVQVRGRGAAAWQWRRWAPARAARPPGYRQCSRSGQTSDCRG